MNARPHSFLADAELLLERVRCGIHDDARRSAVLSLVGHSLRLAEAALGRDQSPEVNARLKALHREHVSLVALTKARAPKLSARLKDWTEPVDRPSTQVEPFDLAQALDQAAAEAASPGAAFRPAERAIRAGWPAAERGGDAQAELDSVLRLAAVEGNAFRVIAVSIVASMIGDGSTADAILAALTTPALRSGIDRGGLRIVYASLALLAHPHAESRERAAAACEYLLRRERPGMDEILFLSPAALLSRRQPDEMLDLYAHWLEWTEDELSATDRHAPARNICCSLDQVRFEPLGAAMHRIGQGSRGERLIRNLADENAEALRLVLVNSNNRRASQCEARPGSRVFPITRPDVADESTIKAVRVGLPRGNIPITLGEMREASNAVSPAAFTGAMRRGRRAANG